MVILGAGGHAKEVLDVLKQQNIPDKLAFYDDVSSDRNYPELFKQYKRLRTFEELNEWFIKTDNRFLLGIGELEPRKILRKIGVKALGEEQTLIATNAVVSDLNSIIGKGTQIMSLAFISADVHIGNSVLVNSRVNIHHDVILGSFCEIGPGATILGRVQIGHSTFIGAGAIILPGVKIGHNCTVGAGAVVTKNINDNMIVKGNPAK